MRQGWVIECNYPRCSAEFIGQASEAKSIQCYDARQAGWAQIWDGDRQLDMCPEHNPKKVTEDSGTVATKTDGWPYG